MIPHFEIFCVSRAGCYTCCSYEAAIACYTCAPGTYKDTDTADFCTDCPAGFECSTTASK